MEHVRDLTSPGFYSLLFLVPKTSGEFRPVIDLSCLNRFLDIPTFRMETAERIRACLRPDFWVTSLDLQDAYFHIPVHPAYRKYLRFQIEKEFFQFCALPFGIATAPWLFTMVMAEVKRIVHRWGIQLFQYLDDWLIQASSKDLCALHTRRVLALCDQMGLLVNHRKTALVPTQEFVFLGYDFRLTNVPLFSTSKENAENLGSHSRYHQTPRSASTLLASTTGSPRIITEDGSSWSPSHEGNSLLAPGVLGLRPTHVKPIRPSVSIGTQRSLMVDVGVQCVPGFTHCASGSNRPLPHGCISIGMGSALGHAHHLRTMDSGGSEETYQRSRVRCGGQSLRKVETPSVRLEDSGRTRQLDCSCLPKPPRRHQVASPSSSHRARVRALRRRLLHLGGQTHTREKERPCRQPLQGGLVASGEWTLNPSVFLAICRLWGSPTVDLFATRQNTRLPVRHGPNGILLLPSTSRSGVDSWIGVAAGKLIPSRHLPL